ncbi:MAG: PTS sugar transporter subunit IIA [Kiritimatiellae bacterium]|nr:PTS sugar transporter subunit IIA [Kiritimatiellia bacterium]
MPHRQLSFKEAYQRVRIPEQTLRDAVKYGEVPHRKQGTDVIFKASELDAWASARLLALSPKTLLPEHTASTRMDVKNLKDDIILPQLLKTDYIDLDFRAKTRKSVIRDLVDAADAKGLLCDPADLLNQLEEREAVSSTALPGGIALPHPHHPDPYLIMEPFMLIARARKPVWFGAEDDAPTDLFVLLCCGENMSHLHVLARVCMMVRETTILEKLRAAETPDEAMEALLAAEHEVLSKLR